MLLPPSVTDHQGLFSLIKQIPEGDQKVLVFPVNCFILNVLTKKKVCHILLSYKTYIGWRK